MSVFLADKKLALRQSEVDKLWQEVMKRRHYQDEEVTIQVVDEKEIRRLNELYRQVDEATNILTFSYGEGEHDIAVCLEVAEREAEKRKLDMRSYTAILVTHALLHVVGMDHEASDEDEREMSKLEESIVASLGIAADHL